MKATIVGQIGLTQTGLGKSLNDVIEYVKKQSKTTQVNTVDITNNKRIFVHLFHLLMLPTDVFYFTPAGSLGGHLRDILFLMVMVLRQKKIVLHYHNSSFEAVLIKHKWLHWIDRWLFSKVDTIIVLGEKSRDMFASLDVDPHVFKVIRNSIDDALFISKEAFEIRQQKDTINVIFFSNMIEAKGYNLVLEAAIYLSHQEHSPFQFYFSGKFFDPQLQKAFLQAIQPLPNTVYIDGVYGEAKVALLKKMDVFVLPSMYPDETLPISMLEAMGNAMYIIVTDVGVISEVILPETSTLVKLNDVASIIEALKYYQAHRFQFEQFSIDQLKQRYHKESILQRIYDVMK